MRGKCKPSPEKGDRRIKSKFLLFPVCINNEWRWLEYTNILQEFEGWDYANMDCYQYELWRNIKFKNNTH